LPRDRVRKSARRATFPTLDFSLVHTLDEAERAVDMFVEKRGGRACPARTIPAAVKHSLADVPEHLEVRAGTIDAGAASAIGNDQWRPIATAHAFRRPLDRARGSDLPGILLGRARQRD
jgi:hypothetical protein